MTKIALALAASTLLGALGMTAASAAPAMPAAATVAGDQSVDQVAYRHRHQGMRYRGMGHGRHMRRMPASRMGSNPNSRNPQQPGYMQQKGQTTGGPKY